MTAPKSLPRTQPQTRALARRGLYLVIVRHDGMRARRLPNDRAFVVGRAPDCDAQIEAPALSRAHFSIAREGTSQGDEDAPTEPSLVLRDLGSSNGTSVNGRRIPPHGTATLEVGSLIEAGGVFFVLRDDEPLDVIPASEPEKRGNGDAPAPLAGVVVAEAAMQRLHELVDLVARSSISVLVTGETGSGKDVISAAVHARSPRASKPYVTLNCAALPENLLESELFGFERGAFTGATQAKQGLIESAHEGTLFLDEIGEMPRATQAKLLRVLENGQITRLGALRPRVVDVRFVAATNRHLPTLVEQGEFRRDLYFRLNGITIPVPPLRERSGEILPLARHFLALAAERAGRRPPTIAESVVPRLLVHTWPGNIRELKNVMDRAMALCLDDVVGPAHVLLDPPVGASGGDTIPARAGLSSSAPSLPPPPKLPTDMPGRILRIDADTERRLIEDALARTQGNQSRAAELLGISRRTLVNRLNEHAISRPRKR